MIKLILSDIDGTLIPETNLPIPAELFELIPRLRERGVLFCPASGRQYHSIRSLFAPVADEILYMSENGAAVYGAGPEGEAPLLSVTEVEREMALELANDIADMPGCDVLVSGVSTSYLVRASDECLRLMRDVYRNKVVPIDRAEDITEPIIKEAAYIPGVFEESAEPLKRRWGGRINVDRAGPLWLDFTVSNKGTGLSGMCASLGIDRSEVMAFGDNWNDAAMLDLAGEPWIMATAEERLRSRYANRCENVISTIKAKFSL